MSKQKEETCQQNMFHFVQIDSTIHIFELDLKNLSKSGDGEHFDEELFHLNEPFHCPEGLQTGLIVYLFKLLLN